MPSLARHPALVLLVVAACETAPPPSPQSPPSPLATPSSPASLPSPPSSPGSIHAQAGRDAGERFSRLTVDQLAYKLEKKEPLALYDVSAREQFAKGHIASAKWADASAINASVLPADKSRPLVFYCSDEACTAAHKAATTALDLGYPNVSILPAGTTGWEKAGRSVERLFLSGERAQKAEWSRRRTNR